MKCGGSPAWWFARQRWRAWIETTRAPAQACRASRFARQRWRAWIETSATGVICGAIAGSPVSDGGRGLKQPGGEDPHAQRRGSPVSDGGRGLKPKGQRPEQPCQGGSPVSDGGRGLKLSVVCQGSLCAAGSPVSDGGRGLKPHPRHRPPPKSPRFARQRWRAWIETIRPRAACAQHLGSPVSDGGRGLKRTGSCPGT